MQGIHGGGLNMLLLFPETRAEPSRSIRRRDLDIVPLLALTS